VRPEDTFEVEVNGVSRKKASFHIIADDKVDDGPPIRVIEIHHWPQEGPVEPMFLYADNSLEARLARREAGGNKEPGYCANCGTTSLGDFNECEGDCWWVNIEEEPRRVA
jgi:hypothetical protein